MREEYATRSCDAGGQGRITGIPSTSRAESAASFLSSSRTRISWTWVRLRPDAGPLNAEGLRVFCANRIAHFKIPRYVHVVEEFPMTVTGKVQKYLLRAKAVELLGLQQAADVETA
jgi:acyl-CoA synthetase (AMP-forming)/AMP-acid ligase II